MLLSKQALFVLVLLLTTQTAYGFFGALFSAAKNFFFPRHTDVAQLFPPPPPPPPRPKPIIIDINAGPNDNLLREEAQIQPMDGGACQVYGPLDNQTVHESLGKCTEIIGDLEFKPNVEGHINANIKKLTGCLKMEGTRIRGANLFKTMETIDCPPPERHIVRKNRMLCVDDQIYNKFKNLSGMRFEEFEVLHKNCPICYNDTYNTNCQTVAGDLRFTPDTNTSWSLAKVKVIYGRLLVTNVTTFRWFDRDYENMTTAFEKQLEISNQWTDEPAIEINNSNMPEELFFTYLAIRTFGSLAMTIRGDSYRMDKGVYERTKARLPKGKDMEANREQFGECYQSSHNGEGKYTSDDLPFCQHIIGKIVYESSAERNAFISWVNFTTDQDEILIEGGSELSLVFNKPVHIHWKKENATLKIKFRNPVCWDADVLVKARTWVPTNGPQTLKHEHDTTCEQYVGHINDFELRHTTGEEMYKKKITGYLVLNETTLKDHEGITYGEDPSKWQRGMARLSNLTLIHKPHSMYYNVPVVDVVMCGHKWDLPQFIFTVNLTSDRDDDVLLRVAGPSFKMSKENYTTLLTKYPANRLDIDVITPDECFFHGPVEDLSQLDPCEVVLGDLILNENTVGTTTAKLRQVTGCIDIQNTTLDNLDFFDFYAFYTPKYCHLCKGQDGFAIQGNLNLCVYHKEFFASKDQVKGNKPGCGSELDDHEIADRNFIIYDAHDEAYFEKWENITEINGKIVIVGTFCKNLTIFPNLKRIHHRGVGPSITVENNLHLEIFKLPSLEAIKQSEKGVTMLFRNNPKLKLPESQKSFFKRAVGSGQINVTDEVAEKDDDIKDVTFMEGLKVGIGSSVGIVLGLLLLVILAVVAMFVVRKVSSRSSKKTSKATAKPEKLQVQVGNINEGQGAQVQPQEDQNKSKIVSAISKVGEYLGSKFGGTPNEDYEVVEVGEDNNSVAPGGVELSVAGPATAKTAMKNYHGGLRGNASVMHNEKGPSHGGMGESRMGDVTARTAYFGKGGWHGDLKENASRMRKIESKGPRKMGSKGPQTAATANLGKDGWHGNLKDNVSNERKIQSRGPMTAASAYLGNDVYHGNLKDNVSHLRKAESKGGPATARTAYIGKGGYKGEAKENVSKMEKSPKPITANTANVGRNGWKGSFEVPEKGLEKSADSKGKPEFELSVESKLNPATARTAYIGKNQWKGADSKEPISKTHNSKSGEESNMMQATARTAYIGKKDWKGGQKSNEMVREKNTGSKEGPATAVTAMIGNAALKKTKSVESVEMAGKKSNEKSKKSKDAVKSNKKSKEVAEKSKKKDAKKGGK